MTRPPARPGRPSGFVPGLALLRAYRRSWLWPDLVAGLTVGAMLIPQSMGYAELAGMAPQYGFYAVIAALVVYALVGTSRHLGVGPEPGTAILAATGVASIAGNDPDRYIALMAALALLVGAICLLGSALRLGYIASMLSKPVLVGYITGVGLTLLSSQIASFTGVRISADSFFPRFWQLLTRTGDVRWPTFALGAGTLAVMLVVKWRRPSAPAALIGVVVATVVVAMFALDGHGIVLTGAIPAGLPVPALPDVGLDDAARLLPIAAGIALVGFTDNVLTARAIAADKQYRIEPNQELFALGMINLSAGLSQGFPISSSASRSAVPASLGSRTQLVSLVGSTFVVITLLGLRPVLSHIPRAALAAVIISAAINIIDLDGFTELWRVSHKEFALAASTVLGVVVLGVLPGIVIAVVLSVGVALSRIAHPHDAVLGDLPGLDGWADVEEYTGAITVPGLVVFRFDAPLFFLNAERFSDRVEQVLGANLGSVEWLVIDCEGIGEIDASAIDVLRDLLVRLGQQKVKLVAVARANDFVLSRLQRAELIEPAGPLSVYPTINAAVRSFHQRST
jgi:sulfate permease, SulP family